MRPLALVFLAACASSSAPAPTVPEPRSEEPLESTGDSTSSCRVWARDSLVEWTLDGQGRPIVRYENSDAAGAQWSSRWERDAQGRTVLIETEMLEGMGMETGEGDSVQEPTYRTEADGSVVASYEHEGETEHERWTYDGQGRPTRRERWVEGEEPRVLTCEYDEQGRVAARDGWRYTYVGERVVPSSVQPPDGAMVPVVAFGQTFFMGELERPYTHTLESLRYVGDCIDVIFQPCSPAFAPPVSGRSPSRLPAPSGEPLASMEEVVLRHLGCGPADDPEERCTVERVERARNGEEGDLREVALVTIARGASGFMSTHLLMRVSEGWWLGPQLADGPFNGNQMVGTLRFQVSEVSLRSVDPEEEGPALVARYETETMEEIDETEHAVVESGFIVCLAPGDSHLRCARVAEAIEETIDGETTTASAELTFVGDGTIAVAQPTGSHERVPNQTFPIEWLFQ